ncbi:MULTISPECIES: hypothetical protein [Mycobacteroides]|jgi:hypothetical protein|uniref:hypothetical protein n=1 Tax=Mycobacteroides TaxID=670516 RepID=UPI0009F57212|nr:MULTISPECIES: hypothetical protein [Mycobacteroides]MBF9523042.1 hypothetical protein [Mycobacteroides chelonae]
MKIRDDLEGVVYVHTEGGVVVLSAGDTVPDGASVGDHLTSEDKETDGAGSRRGRRGPARSGSDD